MANRAIGIMSQPLMPDQRFLDRMRGIHSTADYMIFEHKYGPAAIELKLGLAPFFKPEKNWDPILSIISESDKKEKSSKYWTFPNLGKQNESETAPFHPLFDLAKNKAKPAFSPMFSPENKEEKPIWSWTPSLVKEEKQTAPFSSILSLGKERSSVPSWTLPNLNLEKEKTPGFSWPIPSFGEKARSEEQVSVPFHMPSFDFKERRQSNYMFPETERLAPMYQKCSKCGRGTFWETCVECDSKEFWKSFNDDEDDDDSYDEYVIDSDDYDDED